MHFCDSNGVNLPIIEHRLYLQFARIDESTLNQRCLRVPHDGHREGSSNRRSSDVQSVYGCFSSGTALRVSHKQCRHLEFTVDAACHAGRI